MGPQPHQAALLPSLWSTDSVFSVLDVKSSWRKAVQEDKAEKLGRALAVGSDAAGGAEPRALLDGPPSAGAPAGPQEAPSRTPPPPPPLWDTLTMDSPSGSGVQFSLEQETLPELASCDSLLSLDGDASFLDRRGTPDQLVSAWDQDWRADLAGNTEKVFSLDLDSLEAPSSPGTQACVLPNLITFSPVDDRKC